MSTTHLFRFGYETPDEFRLNSANGYDYESSAGLWIIETSEEGALKWGRAVAERYVAWLFAQAGEEGYSWTTSRFVNWIETDTSELARCRAANLPAVAVGEMPSFDALQA